MTRTRRERKAMCHRPGNSTAHHNRSRESMDDTVLDAATALMKDYLADEADTAQRMTCLAKLKALLNAHTEIRADHSDEDATESRRVRAGAVPAARPTSAGRGRIAEDVAASGRSKKAEAKPPTDPAAFARFICE
jgi:hypothetical protein